MLGRKEYPARLKKLQPNLSAIDKSVEHRDRIVEMLRENVPKVNKLRPIVAIQSQRRKMEYHPNGDRDITIEIGIDDATAVTITNHIWPIFQLEQEVKENKTSLSNQDLLRREQGLIAEKFPKLVICTESKPTKGFKSIQEHIAEMKEGKWKKQVLSLSRDSFARLPALNQ